MTKAKVVILAGGMQSSISNEAEGIPKPSGREELLLDENGKFRYGSGNHLGNDTAWTNGDYFVFSPQIFSFLTGNYDLEKQLFIRLSEKDQLATYMHIGYWLAVETKRDLYDAVNLWNARMAPWIESQGSVISR